MNLTRIEALLTRDMSAKEIAADLDAIIFNYLNYYSYTEMIGNESELGDNIYTLKMLRDIFTETEKDNNK